MKSTKSKILHKSFLTNQDLIGGVRTHSNTSYTSTKNTTRIHTERSKITLLKKKSFDRLKTEENSLFVPNMNTHQNIGTPMQKAVYLLQDCLTELGEQNPKMHHKLKKILNYLREGGQQDKSRIIEQKKQKEQLEALFNSKLQIEKEQSLRLRKMNDDLKLKIMDYRQRILNIKQSAGLKGREKQQKQANGLSQIIINQSQIIDKQCDQHHQLNNQMKRILTTQALQIQSFIKDSHNQKDQLRLYTSLENSFIFKH